MNEQGSWCVLRIPRTPDRYISASRLLGRGLPPADPVERYARPYSFTNVEARRVPSASNTTV